MTMEPMGCNLYLWNNKTWKPEIEEIMIKKNKLYKIFVKNCPNKPIGRPGTTIHREMGVVGVQGSSRLRMGKENSLPRLSPTRGTQPRQPVTPQVKTRRGSEPFLQVVLPE